MKRMQYTEETGGLGPNKRMQYTEETGGLGPTSRFSLAFRSRSSACLRASSADSCTFSFSCTARCFRREVHARDHAGASSAGSQANGLPVLSRNSLCLVSSCHQRRRVMHVS